MREIIKDKSKLRTIDKREWMNVREKKSNSLTENKVEC